MSLHLCSSFLQPYSSTGLQLFNDVLQDFTGKVIPLGTILQLGSPKLNQILPNLRLVRTSEEDETDAEKRIVSHVDMLVPFSSITHHMVDNMIAATGKRARVDKPGTCLLFVTGKNSTYFVHFLLVE
jgi:hypothetical protein